MPTKYAVATPGAGRGAWSRSSRSAPSRAAWSGRPRRRRAAVDAAVGAGVEADPVRVRRQRAPRTADPQVTALSAGQVEVLRAGPVRGGGLYRTSRCGARGPASASVRRAGTARCGGPTSSTPGGTPRSGSRRRCRRRRPPGPPVALDGQALGPVHGPAGAGVTGANRPGRTTHTMRPRGCALAGRGRRHGPRARPAATTAMVAMAAARFIGGPPLIDVAGGTRSCR